jgi:nucleoside-diphosphate-sugar epimerase
MDRPAILLTGATGFLGGHLFRALIARDERMVIARRQSSRLDSLGDAAEKCAVWNVEDPIGDLLSRHGVDIVVHTATAYGRGGESLADLAAANVVMPLSLLEAARRAGVRAFVNSDTFSAKAAELPEGLDGYVLTKKHFREIAALVTRDGPTRLTNVIIEHMYGEGDRATKFVPSLLRSLLGGVEEFPLTPGGQLRDFVHVSDVVRAFEAVIDAVRAGRGVPVVEVGTGEARPLREIVETARAIAGSRTALRFGALPYRKGELMESRADLSALRALGWAPRVGLEAGLRRTVAAARAERQAEPGE